MGCNCGKSGNTPPPSYVVTSPNGQTKAYKTEVEAAAAATRAGGTYRKV